MTEARWAIRFYVPFEENNTLSIVGSYDNSGSRYLDDIVVFSGMYGVPDYMLWYIHKDLISYNFAGYSIELRLMLGGDPNAVYFQERYRVISVTDDFKSDRKVLYAIQEDHTKLGALLIDAKIATLEYDETRNAEKALKDVLEANGIFGVVFCEHKDTDKRSIQFEYPKLTLDPSWTVGDFIRYIAQENNFEWAVKYGLLFIGPELYTYPKLNASRDYIDRTVDNISRTYHTVKIAWNGSPLNVLYYYEQTTQEKVTPMRCVWAKHWVGAGGDVTKGCFYPIGRKMEKQTYFESLEGEVEKDNALEGLFTEVLYNQVKVVRIVEDSGENEYAEEITLEKDIDEYAKKTPRNMVMNIDEAIYKLPMVGKTTPYLDYKSGLLFPRSHVLPTVGENGNGNGEEEDPPNNPNRLLFSPYDRLEQAVLGPFVMGNGSEDFKNNIPVKDADALRFQLPNGWCMYIKGVKEDDEDYDYPGETLIQMNQTDHESAPVEDDTKVHLYMRPNKQVEEGDDEEFDGIIRLVKGENTYIEIDETDNIEIRRKEKNFLKMWGTQDDDEDNFILQITDDYFLSMDKDGNIIIQKDANNFIKITSDNKVNIQGEAEFKITVGSSILTMTTNTITMTNGSVTATMSGSVMDVA